MIHYSKKRNNNQLWHITDIIVAVDNQPPTLQHVYQHYKSESKHQWLIIFCVSISWCSTNLSIICLLKAISNAITWLVLFKYSTFYLQLSYRLTLHSQNWQSISIHTLHLFFRVLLPLLNVASLHTCLRRSFSD